jgi:hypothetical protein
VLAAQIVNLLPVAIAITLNIPQSLINVLTIEPADTVAYKKRDLGGGVIVSLAIPVTAVGPLDDALHDPASKLFSPSTGPLGIYIDSTYDLITNQTNTTLFTVQNPNLIVVDPLVNVTGNYADDPQDTGSHNGVIIGVVVAFCTVLYAAVTIVAIRYYKRRKERQAYRQAQMHNVFNQAISAPVMQENSLGFQSQ